MGYTVPNQVNLSISTGLAQVRFEKHLTEACIGSLWLGRYVNGNDAGRTVFLRRISRQWLSQADSEWVRQGAGDYAKVRHPSLIKLLGIVESGDDLVTVSEHIEGVRILELMRAVFTDGVPIPATVAVRIVLDAARATWTAHRLAADAGLLPTLRLFVSEGVLVTGYGGTLLTEVGVLASLARCVVPRTVPSLLAQLAPEELGARTAHSGSPEVFSLGVLLWELLANRWLFSHESDSRTHQDLLLSRIPNLHQIERCGLALPEPIVELVSRATQRDPSLRFGSVQDMIAALEQLPPNFVASERQVSEVVRQRTAALLKLSKSEEAERTISGTFAEVRTESPSVIPPSTPDYDWDRPTFAQRSLVNISLDELGVVRLATLDGVRGETSTAEPYNDVLSEHPRRNKTIWVALAAILLAAAGSVWFFRHQLPLAARSFTGPAPAGAVSPRSAEKTPVPIARETIQATPPPTPTAETPAPVAQEGPEANPPQSTAATTAAANADPTLDSESPKAETVRPAQADADSTSSAPLARTPPLKPPAAGSRHARRKDKAAATEATQAPEATPHSPPNSAGTPAPAKPSAPSIDSQWGI